MPLDWQIGWPAHSVADDLWRVVVTEWELEQPFEFKSLVDDSVWQAGDNEAGLGGGDMLSVPTYE